MTKSIRDAAQALLNAVHELLDDPERMEYTLSYKVLEDLRAALSAPQPTADERVAEHMRLAEEYYFCNGETNSVAEHRAAVEQSARALLSPSQDDAEHAAMYRWLRDQIKDESTRVAAQALLWNHNSRTELDAAIRAAMKETK